LRNRPFGRLLRATSHCLLPAALAANVSAQPVVQSVVPADQAIGVGRGADIVVDFSVPPNPATLNDESVIVTTSLRGQVPGTIQWEPAANRLRFNPVDIFLTGERVRVQLTKAITDAQGIPLENGFHAEFSVWTAAVPTSGFLSSGSSWSTGGVALNVTVADLTGDRRPEVIFSNTVPDSLTILSPNASGGFIVLARLETGILPRHTYAADVDGNGHVDLVCCASGPNEVDVFLNSGGGTFGAAVAYETGQTPYGAYVGDLDADGDPDIATANFNGHDVSVLLNAGDGTFDTATNYSAGPGADSPRWVDGADLDLDGDLDLVCCNGYSYDLSIFLNDGDGMFTVQPFRPDLGESPNFLEVRDFNGDGLVDVVSVNAGGASLSFLAGNGDGTFEAAIHSPVGGTLPYGIQVYDMDGDGDLDVVVPVRGSNDWRILSNSGAGTFTVTGAYPGGNHCHTVAAADWDEDGDIDVVAGFVVTKNMFFYEHQVAPNVVSTSPVGNATGTPIGAPISLYFATDLEPSSVTAEAFQISGMQSGPHAATLEWISADRRVQITPLSPFAFGEIVSVVVNGTGLVQSVDGLVHSGFTLEYMTETAPAAGSFTPVAVPLPGSDPVALAAADFDGDGASDLVVANFLSGDVTLLLTGGAGLPEPAASVPVGEGPIDLWPGDFNEDGAIDLATVNVISGSVSVLINQGGGTFVSGGSMAVTGAPFGLTGGDFDADGDIDLAVAMIDPGGIATFWNSGTGNFPVSSTAFVSGAPLDVAAADVDHDGDLELIACDSQNHRMRIFVRTGNAFHSVGTFATGNTPVGVFPWDTNGDGWIDLVSADFGNGGISVLENLGSGISFAPAFSLPSNDLPHAITGADLTGDTTLELVTANSGGSDVTVFRNLGNGVYDGGTSFPAGITPYDVVAGDWDGDGRVDLAAVNRTSGDVVLLMNSSAPTAVLPSGAGMALRTALVGARPNPSTGPVGIDDLHGRSIATILDEERDAGLQSASWDGRDASGRVTAAGVYFLRMDAERRGWTEKVLRLR